MNKVAKYSDFIAEAWSSPTPYTVDILDSFVNSDEGRDLRAIGVSDNPERNRVRLERRNRGESMPRTGVFKDQQDGKYHIEHYSSKPGLEVYGQKSFDTPEELFRYLWIRIAKNIIPASLMSRREVEKKINFDELFPIGSRVSQQEFLEALRPILGGEELDHPSNDDLLRTDTIKKLLDLSLIGKKDRYSSEKSSNIIVKDISQNARIKYKFYCNAAQTIRILYSDLVMEILGDTVFTDCLGSMRSSYVDYETWTVTNTNRLPLNSVNYRTGENTLRCHVQDNDMMAAVFLSIIKRTFKRAKGKTAFENLIWNPNYPIVAELNGLLSDYFFEAASTLEPSVFVEGDLQKHPQIIKNGRALLVKYLLKNGSITLKGEITNKSELKALVDFSTRHEDIDVMTKRLIKASKALIYV